MKSRVFAIGIVWILVCALFVGMICLFDEFVEETEAIIVPVDYPTIQSAIENATPGETIYVWAGVYNEIITVNKTLSIIGNGTTDTIIDASGLNNNAINITSQDVEIAGFNITNNGTDHGIYATAGGFNIHDNLFYMSGSGANNYGVFVDIYYFNPGSTTINEIRVQDNVFLGRRGLSFEIIEFDAPLAGSDIVVEDMYLTGNNINVAADFGIRFWSGIVIDTMNTGTITIGDLFITDNNVTAPDGLYFWGRLRWLTDVTVKVGNQTYARNNIIATAGNGINIDPISVRDVFGASSVTLGWVDVNNNTVDADQNGIPFYLYWYENYQGTSSLTLGDFKIVHNTVNAGSEGITFDASGGDVFSDMQATTEGYLGKLTMSHNTVTAGSEGMLIDFSFWVTSLKQMNGIEIFNNTIESGLDGIVIDEIFIDEVNPGINLTMGPIDIKENNVTVSGPWYPGITIGEWWPYAIYYCVNAGVTIGDITIDDNTIAAPLGINFWGDIDDNTDLNLDIGDLYIRNNQIIAYTYQGIYADVWLAYDMQGTTALTQGDVWITGNNVTTYTGEGIDYRFWQISMFQVTASRINGNVTIDDNTVNSKKDGIRFESDNIGMVDPASYGTFSFSGNTVTSGENGIFIDWGTHYPQVSYEGVTIADNSVNGTSHGIWLQDGDGTEIVGNTIWNNSVAGIQMDDHANGTIWNNTVKNNAKGFSITAGNGNLIYQNNIINNAIQADDDGTNIWNLTYPGGGNYWSDYTGMDSLSGPNQDILGSDGLGDTPYENIVGVAGAKDHYPLTRPTGAPEGNIIITSHEDGEYVSGIIVIEAVATFGDLLGINFYINGTHMFTDSSYPYQYVLDTTTLNEDEGFEVKAEALLRYSYPVHTTITLFTNNIVDVGDYITVSTLKSEYQPDEDVTVLVNIISPPAFDSLDLVVGYEDPSGNPLYTSEDSLPSDTQYLAGLPLFSDAILGTYTVTAHAYGYVNDVLIWEATNGTTFVVSGESIHEHLENLSDTLSGLNVTLSDIQIRLIDIQSDLDSMNLSLEDLQNVLDYLNQTLPVQFDNLSAQLDSVNDSLLSSITDIENTILGNLTEFNDTNIMDYLQGMNNSLYTEIQILLTNITNDISGVNDSLSDQLTDLLNNMTTDNDALRDWLDIVLGQIDANLTAANATLQQQLADLNATMDAYYNDIISDLNDVFNSLTLLEANLSAQHDVLNDTIDNLNETITGAPGLSTQEIMDRINDSIILMESLDTNMTAHDSDINAVLNALNNLVQNQHDMTRAQLIDNVTDILGDIQDLDADIVSHDQDVLENMTTIQDLINNIGALDISELSGQLMELEQNLTTHDDELAQEVGDINQSVSDFQTEINGRLDDIETTLDDLAEWQDVLDELNLLGQAIAQGDQEIQDSLEEIPKEKKEEEGFGMTEMLLIIVLVLLIINLLIMLMGSKKGYVSEAIPDEEKIVPMPMPVEKEEAWEGPVEEIEEEPEKEYEEMEELECPECGTALGPGVTVCPKCGEEFEIEEE